jgi:hypothetical protein
MTENRVKLARHGLWQRWSPKALENVYALGGEWAKCLATNKADSLAAALNIEGGDSGGDGGLASHSCLGALPPAALAAGAAAAARRGRRRRLELAAAAGCWSCRG